MNVAVGACRLGHPTNFVGHYGPDAYGESINAHLNASSVQLPFEPTAGEHSVAQATIGADGAAEYEFDIEWALDAIAEELAELARTPPTRCTPVLSPPCLSPAHTLSRPPSGRPRQRPAPSRSQLPPHPLIHDVGRRDSGPKSSSPSPAWSGLRRGSAVAPPQRSLEDTARAWLDLGAEKMVITRGETAPSPTARNTPRYFQPAYRVEVADTVGAGDSLMAALIAGLLDRGIAGPEARAKVAALAAEDIADLMHFSATAAHHRLPRGRQPAHPRGTRRRSERLINGAGGRRAAHPIRRHRHIHGPLPLVTIQPPREITRRDHELHWLRTLPREPYADLPELPEFTLTSTDVQDGTAPRVNALRPLRRDRRSGSLPQLSWRGFPEGTKSFVLTCFDPDAPTPSGFWHWTVSNIPAEVTSIDTGADAPAGALTHRNDAGVAGLPWGLPLRLVTARTATFSASPPWMWRSSTLTSATPPS